MILDICLTLVLIGAIAMLHNRGLFSNAITLINVITAALIATTWWEPLANVFDGKSTWTYFVDYLSIWALFLVSLMILQVATDFLSRSEVRFHSLVNLIGGYFLTAWIAWVLLCFITMTLHMAPLPKHSFGGHFQAETTTRMFFGMAPDHQWLAFVHKLSKGSLATSAGSAGDKPAGLNVFDPRGEFVYKYAERRQKFERARELRVNRN